MISPAGARPEVLLPISTVFAVRSPVEFKTMVPGASSGLLLTVEAFNDVSVSTMFPASRTTPPAWLALKAVTFVLVRVRVWFDTMLTSPALPSSVAEAFTLMG